jgi:non-ribosomal peptide synthetase component F
VILAIFNVLLANECDREDILIGIPVAGRRHAELDRLIGFFVNMLALRNFPGEEKTFREFLAEVKDKTLKAYDNQDYPFENLVDNVMSASEITRHSLIEAVFVFQNAELPAGEIPELEIPGLKLIPHELRVNFSPFDLILRGYETGEKLIFSFQYKTALFKEETIRMFTRNFKEVAAAVLENNAVPLKDIAVSDGLLTVEADTLAADRGDFDF